MSEEHSVKRRTNLPGPVTPLTGCFARVRLDNALEPNADGFVWSRAKEVSVRAGTGLVPAICAVTSSAERCTDGAPST